jgi:hypothetical protein
VGLADIGRYAEFDQAAHRTVAGRGGCFDATPSAVLPPEDGGDESRSIGRAVAVTDCSPAVECKVQIRLADLRVLPAAEGEVLDALPGCGDVPVDEGDRLRLRPAYMVFFGERSLWQTTSWSSASGVPAVRSWNSPSSSIPRNRGAPSHSCASKCRSNSWTNPARLPAYGVADPDHQVHESTLQLLLSHPASVHQHEVTPHLYLSARLALGQKGPMITGGGGVWLGTWRCRRCGGVRPGRRRRG